MYKRMSLLTAREGISRAEFTRHWRQVHGPLIGQLPGLRGYVQNTIRHDLHRAGDDGLTFRTDGVVELYFDDVGDMSAAFGGELGETIREDEENFLGTSSGYSIAGEAAPRPDIWSDKVIIAMGTADDTPHKPVDALGRLSGIGDWDVDHVETRFGAKAGPAGPQPVAVFLQAKLEPQTDLRVLFDEAGAILDTMGWRGALSIFQVEETRIR